MGWLALLYVSVCLLFDAIGVCVIGWVVYKIFMNLFECRITHTGFSDKHNWVIEPSTSNKISALLATLFGLVYCTVHIVYLLIPITYPTVDSSTVYAMKYISTITRTIGHFFYYLYLISTLQYNMDSDELFRVMIPRNVIITVKSMPYCFLFASIAVYATLWISHFDSYINEIRYVMIYELIELFMQLIIEIVVLYLYIKGLNNISRFWCSKRWNEYEKYGETARTHEILIDITRVSVCLITSVITTNIFWFYRGYVLYIAYTLNVYDWFNIGYGVMAVIDDITYALSVYFIYAFGYRDYEKLCNKCHRRLYRYCQQRNQINNEMTTNDYVLMEDNDNDLFYQY